MKYWRGGLMVHFLRPYQVNFLFLRFGGFVFEKHSSHDSDRQGVLIRKSTLGLLLIYSAVS